MNKEYVQAYAKLETVHWWFLVRQQIILQFLQKNIVNHPARILNIGAAAGASSQWLSALGEVISVENDAGFLGHLQKKQMAVVNASVVSMPFEDNSFDLVCAFDVIEHVADDFAAMKEMERICKPGGIVCITVPAFMMLWSEHDVVNNHQRRYTKRSLLELGKKIPGVKKNQIAYFNFLLFLPILMARKISNLFPTNKNNVRSDFERYQTRGILNGLFKAIFSMEIPLLHFIHFPFGVSLIALWKKECTRK